MTVARDAVLESATFTTTTPHTFVFTPVGTPKAIIVAIAHGTVSTDLINGTVSYGGVAMTRVATNGFAQDTVGEIGAAYLYFLGSSIPTGAQTVSISHTGSADVKWAICASMTATSDTQIVVSGKLEGDVANPSIALDTSATSALRVSITYSGLGTLANLVELTGMEVVAAGTGHDFGNFVALLGQQTTASTGSFTIGHTAASDDVAMCAAAIEEASGAQPLTGTLFSKTPTFNVGVVSSAGAIAGILFVKTATFPTGAVSMGQTLSGTLFTKAATFPTGYIAGVVADFPIIQQVAHRLTGTSISGLLRQEPAVDNMVFAVFSAATTLANMAGPAGYTKAVEEQGDGISIQLWYKRAGASESATVTATSSASVPLKIHVFEAPKELFATGDPLHVVASNDSSTSTVTTLATGTTAPVDQPNMFAIAGMATLGGTVDFWLNNWTNGFTGLADHETRGQMSAFKIVTAVEAVTSTATWSPTMKAAGLVATFRMASVLQDLEPAPRRVSFGFIRSNLNTTGTVVTVPTFPAVTGHLYLAFVGVSKTGGVNANSTIPVSHGGSLTWDLHQAHFIGTARRVHMFRAMPTSDLAAAAISITTDESATGVWWLVLDVTGVELGGNGINAIRQVNTGDEPSGDVFLEVALPSVPLTSGAVVGVVLHGAPEPELEDIDPDIHIVFGAAQVGDSGGQWASVQWYHGSDQILRWDWASSIHAISIVAELAIPVVGVSQTPNATTSNVGWDTAPLAGQSIHTYVATDDTDYITVTVP